ncbi:MAG: 30S ribosomal protein S4 [Planctomycetota bacterium]|nr:MAG: 30S ribosomal protein S4 [Planctomycetota bacterium]
MSRVTKPKHKLCRRLGSCIWSMDKCPSVKKAYPPGQHGFTRSKLTPYGTLLLEKQHLKAFYWLGERQFSTYFKEAKRLKGRTGDNLMALLEKRVDSVLYRSGLTSTIWQAKQVTSHGGVLVNGKKVDRSGFIVRTGDVVSIKSSLFAKDSYKVMIIEKSSVVPYLSVDYKKGEVSLVSNPQRDEIPLTVNPDLIVEFYAK